MTVPEAFRKSPAARSLWATMEFLSERDPTELVNSAPPAPLRKAQKRAADRRRAILEHRASDSIRSYFRDERARVVAAVRLGHDVKYVLYDDMRDDLEETYRSVWGGAALSWGEWVSGHFSRSVGKARKPRPRAYDFGAPVDAWLRENAGKKITGIVEASRKKIAEQIAEGVSSGETLRQIARRVDKFYLEDVIPNRSAVIARTEVGSAVNWAQNFIAEDSGVEMEKEWMALSDDRTRATHSDADGQRAPLGEPFEVGGDLLMYPGDPSGSPEEIISCRCSTLHHVVGEKKSAGPPAPTVEEFARRVAGVESPDVAVALAFARGVFGERDDWVESRRKLMKRVRHLRRPTRRVRSSERGPLQSAGR